MDVLFFKIEHFLVGERKNEIGKEKGNQDKNNGREDIWEKQSPETDTAGQDSDYFWIPGHPWGEKDHRDKRQQITEKINEIRNKIKVVIENDGAYWCIAAKEIVYFFRNVKNYDDKNQKHQRKEESPK